MLTENSGQLFVKLLDAFCAMLRVKQYLSTAYHPQRNGQTKRASKTILQRLRHYVEAHQKNWNIYFQPLT